MWPLSTPSLPKQFVPLIGGRSLFELTLNRLHGLEGVVSPIVVTGAGHLELVGSALEAGDFDAGVIVEPVGRNTAPAALAAALVADPDDIMVILPADHLITDVEGFRQAVTRAAPHAGSGAIVTFGITPTRPETGYGYIEIGEPVGGDAFRVRRFKEKPVLEEAERLSTDGRHLWNSGMFVTRADILLAEAREHCPEVLSGVTAALPEETGDTVHLSATFEDAQAISVDHAVMEKTAHALVIPIDVGWNDIGSYRSLHSAVPQDADGNHLEGDVIVSDVTGSFISANTRKVAVVGLSDVVVVETEDAVLVLPMDRSQDVGEISKRAQEPQEH